MIFRKNKEEPLKQANIKTDRLSEKSKRLNFHTENTSKIWKWIFFRKECENAYRSCVRWILSEKEKTSLWPAIREPGKTHTAIGLGIKACEQGYRVLYTTIPYLVTELKESNSKQKLRTYQKRFEKYDLIIADEFGYISFDREATDLLFTVLSLRASQKSTIITSNPTFERWDEIFEDAAITSAIVDRLTYKAYLIDMEGDSYRLRETLRNNGTDFETVVK